MKRVDSGTPHGISSALTPFSPTGGIPLAAFLASGEYLCGQFHAGKPLGVRQQSVILLSHGEKTVKVWVDAKTGRLVTNIAKSGYEAATQRELSREEVRALKAGLAKNLAELQPEHLDRFGLTSNGAKDVAKVIEFLNTYAQPNGRRAEDDAPIGL